MLKSVFNVVAKQYQGMVAKRCAVMGLKYEDLIIESPDMFKALSRSEPDVRLARERRIKRAFDQSAKKKYVPAEHQPKDVFDFYIGQQMDNAKLEREEREILNGY